jgi:signal transduction histidine kinase/ActR/RegA family two-component response regulator
LGSNIAPQLRSQLSVSSSTVDRNILRDNFAMPSEPRETQSRLPFLLGGGEMGARMRELDWSKTALGAPGSWPQSLRSTVSMLLPSKAQIVLFWGPTFTVIYNDAYRPVFGAKHPAALGVPGREAWSEIWDSVLHELLASVVRTGEAFWGKDLLFVLERNGFPEETYFDVSYDPVRVESGDVGGVYCIVAETTERVIGQRRLALLRELAARNTTGRTAHEACQLAIDVLTTQSQDIPFAIAYLDQDIQCGTPDAEAKRRAARPEFVHRLPIAAPNGGVAGELVVGHNERRPFDDQYRSFLDLVVGQLSTAVGNARAYEEERARAESLAQLDRAKTAFFSNVSHEFRTPLTLMLGPTEDALSSPERALSGDALDMVHRNELRLLKLVNTLLDFSRTEAGRAEATFVPTDLAELTADVASTFRSAFERAGLAFVVDCALLSAPVSVDREMWEKVVLNLLSNALKFTFDGGIYVTLREHEGAVTLQVRDTGVGIPESEIPHLFERFHRVHGSRARTHEGSGIGLALVNELVKMHGGSLQASSRPGDGTVFTVTLPAATRTAAGTTPDAPAPALSTISAQYVAETLRWLPAPDGGTRTDPPAPVAGLGDSGRIIVADDNADMRDYVSRLLSDRWQIEAYGDGASALAAAQREAPALVLADVMMPGLDGFQLLRELQQDRSTAAIPVILLSARAGEEARIEGLQAGAADYLAKPFSARELRARIDAQVLRAGIRAAQAAEAARLSDILKQAPVGVAILRGENYVFEFANAPYLEFVGNREVLGKPLLAALPEIAGQGVEQLLDAVRTSGEPYTADLFRVMLTRTRHGEPEEAFFKFVYQPIGDDARKVDAIAVVAVDVTDLANARRNAESADRAKDEFIAMLGHELRNPLSPILTALQLMRLRGITGADHERSIIERQVNHLVGLVDDLLDVSRITKGKVDLRKEHLELAEVVGHAIETASPLLEERRHHLDVNVPRLGCAIHGDRKRLSQVLANLLTNAAKYTDPGGSIQVTARREGGAVLISVRDDGSGIEPEMQARIFDMFTQAQQTLERSRGGLGLGLAIVKSLVALHGGTVSVFSEGRGRGSTFTVRMPLAASTSTESQADQPALTPARPSLAMRVLIVDDNRDSAEMLSHALTALGYTTEVAFDAATALAAADRQMPDVALLDIGLPVISGFELARRLRAKTSERRVVLIAITGYGQQSDRHESQQAGFDAHLVKPVDLEKLTQLLPALTGREHATDLL